MGQKTRLNQHPSVCVFVGMYTSFTIWGVDSQVYRNRTDPFVLSSKSVCFSFDLLTNFIKICELLSFTMQELAML